MRTKRARCSRCEELKEENVRLTAQMFNVDSLHDKWERELREENKRLRAALENILKIQVLSEPGASLQKIAYDVLKAHELGSKE